MILRIYLLLPVTLFALAKKKYNIHINKIYFVIRSKKKNRDNGEYNLLRIWISFGIFGNVEASEIDQISKIKWLFKRIPIWEQGCTGH